MGLRSIEAPGCQLYEVLPALEGAASLVGCCLSENKTLSVPWLDGAGSGQAGCGWGVLFSVSFWVWSQGLVRAAHLRNGKLGGLRGLVTAKVDHCATLGYVVHPEAFKQLTVVQVEEPPRPVLQASLPVALIAVPILWKKGQGSVGAGHSKPGQPKAGPSARPSWPSATPRRDARPSRKPE